MLMERPNLGHSMLGSTLKFISVALYLILPLQPSICIRKREQKMVTQSLKAFSRFSK